MTTATRHDLDLDNERDYGVVTKPDSIRFERVFPGPLDRVWSYFTEPDKLAKWLARPSSPVRADATVELTWDHSNLSPIKEETPEQYKQFQGMKTTWRVTRFEPQRFLSWIWDEGTDDESEVAVELTPRGDDVELVLTQSGIRKPESISETGGGWHTHLAILSDNLVGREPRAFWATNTALHEEYQRRFGQPARKR